MNLKINGLNFDITEAIRNHVESKLSRINRHADNLINVTVTLSVEKLQHKEEEKEKIEGKDMHVESVESEMYAAVDTLLDKLDRAVLNLVVNSVEVRAKATPEQSEN